MNEMVERVARAIDEAGGTATPTIEYIAKAAIKAMRDPTEEMLSAGDYNLYVYQCMIDAALKDNNNESVTATDNESQDSKSNV